MKNEKNIEILNVLRESNRAYQYTNDEVQEALDMAIMALKDQRPKGKWLDKKTTIKGAHGIAYGRYGCSVCKRKFPSKSNFCPDCGSDMRGEKV